MKLLLCELLNLREIKLAADRTLEDGHVKLHLLLQAFQIDRLALRTSSIAGRPLLEPEWGRDDAVE
jgi:hypothetical protein